MKKRIVMGAAAFALLVPMVGVAEAEARLPSVSDVAAAKSYARWYWQDYRNFRSLSRWCYPGVGVRYARLSRGTLGQARVNGCTVVLTTREGHWSWNELCWTMIHEYGHLYGYGHTRKRGSVMYPYIRRNFWACH